MLKDNIKKARLDAGLTQKEVAEKLGVAQAQYARWENGGRNQEEVQHLYSENHPKRIACLFRNRTDNPNRQYCKTIV